MQETRARENLQFVGVYKLWWRKQMSSKNSQKKKKEEENERFCEMSFEQNF